MSQPLLSGAFDEAQRASPDVRAAAYLHIARVLCRFDPPKAQALVDQAIAIIDTLDAETKDPMQSAAIVLAATVSPPTAFRLLAASGLDEFRAGGALSMALFAMMSHGHASDAVAFLSAPFDGLPFPFTAAMNAMSSARDDENSLRILRGAINAMRRHVQNTRAGSDPFSSAHAFSSLFGYHWRRLPADEARGVVREIAQWIGDAPDGRVRSGFGGGPNQVNFSSSRASWLYQFLSPLQHLDPDLTRSLCADNPELASAAARYPYGMESFIKEMESHAPSTPPVPERPAPQPQEFVYIGRQSIAVAEAIATEFASAFDHARRLHAADAAPDNAVPCECWPSTSDFRSILHAAGEVEGPSAARLLERVPDGDCRLLASIEFAAALQGLPRLGGSTMFPRPRRDREPPPISLADLPAELRPKPRQPLPPARRPNRPPSLDVHIAPTSKADRERPSGGCGADFWVIEGVRLGSVVARLHDVPETRVTLPESLVRPRYDFTLVLPTEGTQETMKRLMRSGIERHFDLTIDQRPREVGALVLSAPEGIRAEPAQRFGGGGFSTGSVSWASDTAHDDDEFDAYDLDAIFDMQMARQESPLDQAGYMEEMMKRFARLGSAHRRGVLTGISQDMTMAALCELLETALGQPVVDETGVRGTYALKVETEATSIAQFLEALWEQTGLMVTAAPREVPMIVVRQAGDRGR